jgi:hypothetical protein
LTEEQILVWADAHYKRTGQWPRSDSGPIEDAPGETWRQIAGALKAGVRGLPRVTSLVRLLAEKRGVRHRLVPPVLTEQQILIWSDEHFKRTGQWPHSKSGKVLHTDPETWSGINAALERGGRSLPGGISLAKLLAERRGVRIRSHLPRLTVEQILQWVDSTTTSEFAEGDHDEKWININQALRLGLRNLPGGSSLARLIKEHRKVSIS